MTEHPHNIRVGDPDADPEKPSHVKGVGAGNDPGGYERMRGHRPDGTSTAARSTGITPEDSEPIMDGMPNLSPP
jgi:hypothetical protein